MSLTISLDLSTRASGGRNANTGEMIDSVLVGSSYVLVIQWIDTFGLSDIFVS